MGRRRSVTPKAKKKKPVNIKLVERLHAGKITTPYKILDGLIADCFSELAAARIAFAWNFAPAKEDGDGQVKMYSVKKGSDLDRNRDLAPYDFVIIFSHTIWNQRFSDNEMVAAVHEALCHCAALKDKHGDPVMDEMDLPVFRLRKPTVKTFPENIAKFGCWRPEVGKLVERAKDFKDRDRPLLKGINDGPEKPKGARFGDAAFGTPEAEKAETHGEANGQAESNGHVAPAGKGKREAFKKVKAK